MIADGPQPYDAHLSADSWPKCWRCSQKLKTDWPVEKFQILGREPPTTLRSKHKLIIEVECSGESLVEHVQHDLIKGQAVSLSKVVNALGFRKEHGKLQQRIGLESSTAWGGRGLEQAACSRVYAFAPGALGKHGVIYRPGTNRSKHMLETLVK
ncbi:MAG TPA: hypothetical protein VNB49_12850 [Candidatus Dormibacteraeota bacterium]|nr:hypothetical protein [Candidatus Dormibacteraeota bacterium]